MTFNNRTVRKELFHLMGRVNVAAKAGVSRCLYCKLPFVCLFLNFLETTKCHEIETSLKTDDWVVKLIINRKTFSASTEHYVAVVLVKFYLKYLTSLGENTKPFSHFINIHQSYNGSLWQFRNLVVFFIPVIISFCIASYQYSQQSHLFIST